MLLPSNKFFSNDLSLFFSPKKSSSTITEPFKKEADEQKTEKKNNEPQKNEILFIVDIDIGKQEDVPLIIYKNQNYQEAAAFFCRENNLDEELIEILEEKIKDQKKLMDTSNNEIQTVRKVDDSQYVTGIYHLNDKNIIAEKDSSLNLFFQSPQKSKLNR